MIDQEMFSSSVNAGFVLALPFHHGDLKADCVGDSMRVGGGAYARDENTSARLCAKNARETCLQERAYLWDTTVLKIVTCTYTAVDVNKKFTFVFVLRSFYGANRSVFA